MNPASEEADSPPPRPFLVIVNGEPGSGETTLARELAPHAVRHELAGETLARAPREPRPCRPRSAGMASSKSMVQPVDREALALNNKLTPKDVEKIDQTMDVLDSEVGTSSRRALQLVSEQPGLVSVVLARQMGVDGMISRAILRELRDLGLVYGLEVGYSVSPRGRAYMRSTGPD